MPSPFPGMDPFIDAEEWKDFHSTFNTIIREQIAPTIAPAFIAKIDHRVILEFPKTDDTPSPYPDVYVAEQGRTESSADVGDGTAVLDAPRSMRSIQSEST